MFHRYKPISNRYALLLIFGTPLIVYIGVLGVLMKTVGLLQEGYTWEL